MIYAKIENEIVTKILCGDIEADNTFIYLPDNTDVYVGVNIGETRDGYLIPLWERIEKGYYIIPDGYTFDGVNVVKIEEPKPKPIIYPEPTKEPDPEMTEHEKILAGIKEVPDGLKIVNGKLEPMTDEEMLEAGQISLEDYNKKVIRKLKRYLKSTDWYYIAKIERGKEVPEEIRKKREEALVEINRLGNTV